MKNDFFDPKMKVLLYIWIINCLLIIFCKYSVVPERYCFDGKRINYCTGKKNEK